VVDDRRAERDNKNIVSKFIPYGRHLIDKDDIGAVVKVLKSDWITQGPAIEKFEKALSEYCGSRYCVLFNSGTSALHAAYFASGLKKGDMFITSPISFVATANAGIYLGAKPVFADIEKDTGNIDVSEIEENISRRTRLIVPVHYAGHPADMDKIRHIAKKHKIHVIEDACHAIGSRYKNGKTGSCRYSDMTVFSFHPVKHITTGEGGAVLTNNKEYLRKLLLFRTHGITKKGLVHKSEGAWYYEMHLLGFNYRITDFQAALGISQLKKLDRFTERRREIGETYKKAFQDNPFFNNPTERDYVRSSYHLYPIRLKKDYKNRRKEMFTKLREKKLGVQVHYIPIYLQPYYKTLGYKKGLCPAAEEFYQSEISIPIYPAMTDTMVKYVIKTIRALL
jgi:UDP-4-amino-4,6-dideoxy-L-N-acetyl-beta-L-altrosamine transaminase